MKFISKRIRKQDIFLISLAFALVMLYIISGGGNFPLDDSWIHQTYARNLAEHGQWAFILDQPSAASTSPLYTLLLAIGYRLGIEFRLWTHFLGAISLAITGMVGLRLAEFLLPKSQLVGIFTGTLLVLAWHLVWSASAGMETMLFSMWTLVLLWLAWREEYMDNEQTQSLLKRGIIFGVVAGLITLTRPEGSVFVALIGFAMLLIRPQGTLQKTILWGIGAGIGFVLVLTPYLILNWQLTGGILPTTASAKQEQARFALEQPILKRIRVMLTPLLAGGQIFLMPGIIALLVQIIAKKSIKIIWYLLPLWWSLALVALYAYRLPAAYQHGRYVIPALPTFILLGSVGTIMIMQWGRFIFWKRVLSRSLALATIVGFVLFAVTIGRSAYQTDVAIIDEEMVATAHWIAENIPEEELLVAHDIGAIGYYAPRPLLDIAGLINPEVIPIYHNPPALWEFIDEHHGQYLVALPDQVPGGRNNPRLCLVFNSNGETARAFGGGNMAVYALNQITCESE